MAKKMKPGQKRCPSCGATVKGPRTKACPKCGHEFKGKPAPKAVKVAPAKATKNGGTVTAEKPEVNKAQAVRDYLKAHPGALSSEIATALTKEGIEIKAGYVANIKVGLKKTRTAKKAAKKPTATVADAPAASSVVEKPTTNGGITLDQVKKVAQTIKTLGGYQHMTEVLEVIKELGGVKKFKDLAEAMSVPAPTPVTAVDAVPF